MFRTVGKPVPRKEGREKVTGQAKYVDDVTFPGMLTGVTVRSPVARGRIRNIEFTGDLPWEQFTIVTAKDIPGQNSVALISDDQPYLAAEFVNHPEEPVVLLAHPDKYLVEKARQAVHLDIDPLPAVFGIEESLAKQQIIWGDDNILKAFVIEKGDVDSVWTQAAHIVTGEYRTGAQEQLYIETNGMIAIASPENGITIWGSMQCPYYIHKALLKAFPLASEKIRIIQMETGGGFGGKEEYPSMLAGHAALLAWKSGRPVKMVYDRAEDLAATTKRHPSRTRIRTAVSAEGKLLGQDIEFILDGGAYATLSPVVLSRGAIHAAGPYQCPNVRIRCGAVATNAPPHGAFRGFGAPQSIFAMERHMDQVARDVGIAPEELRRRNFLLEGETTATRQVIREKVKLEHLLDRALDLADYHSKTKAFAEQNQRSRVKRGIGFASFMHGAGFTGSGERYLESVAGLEALADGRVRILVSSTEIGQGTNTILAQIVAETLNIDYDQVEVPRPDTSEVPNSGPTVASRTCMVVGKLLESAAIGLKQTLIKAEFLGEYYRGGEFAHACARYTERFGPLKSLCQYQAPPGIRWDDETYSGDAYGAFAWAVYVAEVSVDTVTCEITVDDFVALQEVGRVIHPVLAAGQIEGGVAQGIGYALFENVVWKNGRVSNAQMTNYTMPTSVDVPRIGVYFEEIPYEFGPLGAKGIGELPIDGPAPAILNAIENATGLPVNEIPLMPETLMRAMQRAGATLEASVG
jgi:CO/xanthine dehydrogenase Mo-binding subunit